MKIFYKYALFVTGLLTSCILAFGQTGECLTGGCTGTMTQFPSGTFTSTTNAWQTVSTVIWAGEYAVYNVTSGSTYEWSLCSSDGGSVSYDARLTLLNSTGTTTLCRSDDRCETNKPKISWTATFTGTVRVLVTAQPCGTGTSFTTLVWRCSSCGSGSAPANDNCSGATTLSVGTSCSSPTTGNVANATNSLVGACYGTADDDVWYQFTTSTAGNYVIRVTGSTNFDAVVDLRSGTCASSSSIACVDNTLSNQTEVISVSLAASTTYYVRVFDYYTGQPSTTTFTICVYKTDYCEPSYTYGTGSNDFINRVQLGTLDNTPAGTGSSSGPYYNDYTSLTPPNIQAGTSATLTVTVGPYGGQTVAAWIDYNNNNVFEAGEKLGEVTNVAASSTATFNFTVPIATSSGNKRMRVRTVWSTTNILPCDNYSYGEAEDYRVNITPACTTPGTPTSLSSSSITNTSATISWSAGSPTGSPTVTYSWAVGTTTGVTYESGYVTRGTTTSTSVNVTGLNHGTTYYYKVKAGTSCDGTESGYPTAASFTTTCTTPPTPTGLATYNISTTSASFSWSPVGSGSPTIQYSWAVGTSSGVTYESGYLDRGVTTGTSVTTFALSPNTNYFWRVRAFTTCNNTASTYPTSLSFTTTSIPTPLVTWNGSVNTNWDNASNWTPAVVPTVTDNVVIPGGCPNYPVITSGGLSVNSSVLARRCKSLHITGAAATVTFNVSGAADSVVVAGDIEIKGTLNYVNTNTGANNSFLVIAGGRVVVKDGAFLNIGSSQISAGLPAGTINGINDLRIRSNGRVTVEPGATLHIQDALNMLHNALFTQEGGMVTIARSGVGSAADKISVGNTATFRILDGTTRVMGDNDGTTTTWDAIWTSSTSTFDVQGGTLELLNGASAQSFTITLASSSKSVNNLIINKTGQSVLLDDQPLTVNGNLTITAGTFNLNGQNLTLAGNLTNNGTFTSGASVTTTLTGSSKTISGGSACSFGNLTFNSGASYTLTSSASVPQLTVNGTLTVNSGATFTLASGKVINLAGSANNINGTLTAVDNLDGTRDIGFNNTSGTLTVNGNLNADIQVSTGTTTINNSCTINGDVFANTGTLVIANTGLTVTINGSFTNNGTFTANNSTVVFAGNSKSILGSASSPTVTFNNLQFNTGSSYEINPSGSDRIRVNGSFTTQSGCTLTIASGKILDYYGSSFTHNGYITAPGAHNSTIPSSGGGREIDLNNSASLSGNGIINADTRIFGGTTTLTSDFEINGAFTVNSGATFTMTTHTFKVGGNWTAVGGTFNCGVRGTVVFNGTDDRILRTGSTQSGGTVLGNHFRNVRIEMATGKKLEMVREGTDDATNGMRVYKSLQIVSGIFSSGPSTYVGRKISSDTLFKIYPNATFNIGGFTSPDAESTLGNWTPVLKGDFIVDGNVTSTRLLNNGFPDIFLDGARIKGNGAIDEISADVQTHFADTVFQIGDLYIKGDLIIQTLATYVCNTQNKLTVGGHLYVYKNFKHSGTVTCRGHFRDNTCGSCAVDNLDLTQSTFNFVQSGTKIISFDATSMPTVNFGKVFIKSELGGIREIRSNISVVDSLVIESGETLDAYNTSPKNITLTGTSSSWFNNGTFTPRTGTVSFTGSQNQQISGSNSTTFYNLTVNKSGGSVLSIARSATVTNSLALTNGYIETTPSRLITLIDNATCSPAGGSSTSFVRGPIRKIGNDAFVFPTGKNNRWARIGISAPATATTEFTAEYFENPYTNTTSFTTPITQVSAKEYWQLDRSVTTDAVQVTLHWQDADWSGINSCASGSGSDLLVARFDGTNWVSHSNSSTTGSCSGSSAGSITSTSVSSFSPFTFASKTTLFNPLPVSWLNFEATPKTKQVLLNWATGSEIHSDKFYIQRSTDGVTFETIDSVNAVGYSVTPTHYNGIDNHPHKGLNFYRIKQVDIDGAYSYSRIAVVDYAYYEATNTITASILFPNPTVGNVNFAVTSSINQKAQLQVFGLDGRLYVNKEVILEPGNNQFVLDSETFATGIYVVSLKVTGQTITHKLVKN